MFRYIIPCCSLNLLDDHLPRLVAVEKRLVLVEVRCYNEPGRFSSVSELYQRSQLRLQSLQRATINVSVMVLISRSHAIVYIDTGAAIEFICHLILSWDFSIDRGVNGDQIKMDLRLFQCVNATNVVTPCLGPVPAGAFRNFQRGRGQRVINFW